MKTLLYQSPDYFDKHGNVKPHLLFGFACLFLARAWLVFVVAGVSREQGKTLLLLFYPDTDALYMGLAIGFPAVFLLLLAGNLHRYPSFLACIWRWGRALLIFTFSVDLCVQLDHLNDLNWQFHWVSASTLLIELWLMIYILKSRRIQFLFETPIYREEK